MGKDKDYCSVLVTGNRALAGAYYRNGGCVVGVTETNEDDSVAFFDDADAVVLSFDAITERFLRLTACHRYRIAHRIVRERELIVRESLPSDHKAIFDMISGCPEDAFSENLSPGELEDKETFVKYVNTSYFFFGYGMWTVALERRYLPGCQNFAYEDASEEIIGWCGLFMTPKTNFMGRYPVELGYLIREDLRGKGYALRSCRAICDYARDEIGAAGLGLHVSKNNKASRVLAGRLGFKYVSGTDILYYEKSFD